jgi:EmrB/QacA subfamily drug resistance transporter
MEATTSPPLPLARLKLVTWLVTGALFMEILDGALIAPALPSMAQAFGTTALALNIGISVYLLAVGIFIPASGWIADRVGSRKVFMLAIALFTVSSALCGLAGDLWTFVAMRAVQGFSGALMVPVGRLVILKYTPREKLMAAMSALVWPALVAPVIGPPLGGLITLHLGWHWIFFLNVPLGVGALLAAWRVVPDVREPVHRRFDWTGFLLCGAGTFLLMAALERLVLDASVANLVLLGAGAAALALAFRHFGRAVEPMLRLDAVRVPTFRAVLRGGSLARMAIGSAPFLLTLMFQVGFGYDAFKAGWLVLFLFAGNLLMKTVTTPILRRVGYRPVLVWNGVLAAASLALCATLQPASPIWWVGLVLLANGLTRSMHFTALSTVSFADIGKDDMSDANGLSNTIGQLAMAAGITLAAMAVHAGQLVTAPGGYPAYHVAFGVLAVVTLASVIEMALLPKGAGDHFIARK